MTNGVEVRESNEGVTGGSQARQPAAPPPHATGVDPCNPHQDSQEMDKEAPEGQSPAGAE